MKEKPVYEQLGYDPDPPFTDKRHMSEMVDANRFIEQIFIELETYRAMAPTGSYVEVHMTWSLYQMLVHQLGLTYSLRDLPASVFGADVRIVTGDGLKYWISFPGLIGKEAET